MDAQAQLDKAINTVTGFLDLDCTDDSPEAEAMQAFLEGRYNLVKFLAMENPHSSACKCLSYLASTKKLVGTPNLYTVMQEATAAAVAYKSAQLHQVLADSIAATLQP